MVKENYNKVSQVTLKGENINLDANWFSYSTNFKFSMNMNPV